MTEIDSRQELPVLGGHDVVTAVECRARHANVRSPGACGLLARVWHTLRPSWGRAGAACLVLLYGTGVSAAPKKIPTPKKRASDAAQTPRSTSSASSPAAAGATQPATATGTAPPATAAGAAPPATTTTAGSAVPSGAVKESAAKTGAPGSGASASGASAMEAPTAAGSTAGASATAAGASATGARPSPGVGTAGALSAGAGASAAAGATAQTTGVDGVDGAGGRAAGAGRAEPVAGGTTSGGGEAEPAPAAPAWTGSLSLLEEYRLRTAGAPVADSAGALGQVPAEKQATDQDLRFLANGQVLGPKEHFRAMVSADLWLDLDGRAPSATPDLFASQYDYQQPWLAVYTLSAEWRNSGALDLARVGRQTSEHGIPLTFDGASLELRPWGRRVSLFAFGGRSIHFFDAAPGGLFENWVGSAGATFRVGDAVRFEVDWRTLSETVPSQDRTQGVHVTNHSVGATGIARFAQTQVKAFVRSIDGRPSHAGGALTSESESLRAGIDARVHAQLVTLGEVAESENPFFSILGPSLPHLRFKLEAWKEMDVGQAATLGLHLGWRVRALLDGDETRFNRNTAGAYAQAELRDVFSKGTYLSGIAELNYVPLSPARDWSLALGGSAGYSDNTLKVEAGTYFQQFKVNYYQVVEELSSVRTVYGMLGYRLTPWLDARARYQLEIVDRYIHSAYLTLRQEF